jgi:hypothetical protein
MTGTNCDLFTHKSSRSHLKHLVVRLNSILEEFNCRGFLRVIIERNQRKAFLKMFVMKFFYTTKSTHRF